ncbi:hemin uptake protein HemP [Guyparkeria halopsychrophila]|uniref:hemin uptake protein HemP n=1 Tax=Guyparkeria halopsychrophila TaxID=3139421 RepID=UPI0037CC44E0
MTQPPKNNATEATEQQRPDRPASAGQHCIDSRQLISRDGQCWIFHDGQRYQLRVTAANKLILTK